MALRRDAGVKGLEFCFGQIELRIVAKKNTPSNANRPETSGGFSHK